MSKFNFTIREESGVITISDVWSNENRPVILGKKVILSFDTEEEAEEARQSYLDDPEKAQTEFAFLKQ